MDAYHPQAWSAFFQAEAGAAAGLVGLVIVAISINLKIIVSARLLSSRAAETILLLTGVLVLSTLGLIPGQSQQAFGMECLGVGGGMAFITSVILYRVRAIHHPQELRWLRWFFNWGASAPVGIAGLTLLSGHGGGIYWLVPGVVVALIGGIVNSWILLIEILR
jgi:modulator of FtsH protease